MRFCKDCQNYNDIGALCVRGKREAGFDAVTGRQEYRYTVLRCVRDERESIWPWRCGKSGRHFQRSNVLADRPAALHAAGPATEGRWSSGGLERRLLRRTE